MPTTPTISRPLYSRSVSDSWKSCSPADEARGRRRIEHAPGRRIEVDATQGAALAACAHEHDDRHAIGLRDPEIERVGHRSPTAFAARSRVVGIAASAICGPEIA